MQWPYGKAHILSSLSLKPLSLSFLSLFKTHLIFFADKHVRPDGLAPIQSLPGSDPGAHQSHLQARMLPLFRHSGNLFSSLSFPFGSREKKDKEESVVRERKLIFLALCYSFVSFLFLFSFSLSFTALKLMCLLKCLFDDYSLFISVGCWENESVVGKESLSFCTIQISSLNFLGLPFFWFWGNIQIKIRNTFFFAKQTLHSLLSNLFVCLLLLFFFFFCCHCWILGNYMKIKFMQIIKALLRYFVFLKNDDIINM